MSILSVTDIISPHITDIQVSLSRGYKDNGRAFIGAFLKYKSIQMACGFCCKQFENETGGYVPDEKIVKFVDKLDLDDTGKRLLSRTLKMIKMIAND